MKYMDKIVLSGSPLSNQHIYANTGNRRYMKKKAKERKEQYYWEAKSQWRKKVRTSVVGIDLVLVFGDRRRRDIDNYCKLPLDALEGVVYTDDKQIDSLNIEKTYDKEEPRIEIYVH